MAAGQDIASRRSLEAPPRWTRYAAGTALIVSSIAIIVVLAWGGAARPGIGRGTLPNGVHLVLVLVACTAYVAMLAAQRRWGGLKPVLVAGAIGAQAVAAIAAPPRSTRDLWWYAIYGRIAGVHHANPYVKVPAKFPSDPFLRVVGTGWIHTKSAYGPLFTGVSAGAAKVLGSSLLATRLFYQGLAFAAVAAACVILWRTTSSIAAVAVAGAHPLVALILINGGKNDALVGLALLGAVVLSARGHHRAAGVVGALGALVKITGLVGLAVAIVVVWRSGRRRAALQCAATGAMVLVAGYALVGSAALLTPMSTAGARFTRISLWKIFPISGLALPSASLAIAVMTVFVLFLVLRAPNQRADTAVTEAMTAMTLAAPYTLPSYLGWSLPTAALDHESRVSRITVAFGLLLVVAYEVVGHPTERAFRVLTTRLAPIAVLVLIALVVLRHRRSGPRARADEPSSSVAPAALVG